MHPHQALVRDFHVKFGLTVNDTPTVSPADNKLRHELHMEEYMELSGAHNKVDAADALGDLRYVILGSAVTYGLLPKEREGETVNLSSLTGRVITPLEAFIISIEAGSLSMAEFHLGSALTSIRIAAEWLNIPLDAVFEEVHRSNMSKLWTDAEVEETTGDEEITGSSRFTDQGRTFNFIGGEGARLWLVKRADGKVLKSPSYSRADITGVLIAKAA